MKQIFSFKIFGYSFSFEYLKLSEYKRYRDLLTNMKHLETQEEKDKALGDMVQIGNEWNL